MWVMKTFSCACSINCLGCLCYVVNTCAMCVKYAQLLQPPVFSFLTENLSSDSGLSSPSALNSPGQGIEGLNRRRKKRTSIETNIRVALEKSFLEVSGGCGHFTCRGRGIVGMVLTQGCQPQPLWMLIPSWRKSDNLDRVCLPGLRE